MFEEIRNYQQWRIVEKINKGWSDDTKYYIETSDHKSCFYGFLIVITMR